MGDEGRKETPKGTGGPPPIIVTTNINLINVQNEIKTKPKGDFALRNTRNGFRISTKSMEDYLTLKKTFRPKSNTLLYLPSKSRVTDKSCHTPSPGRNSSRRYR
jgi:hypothetical protein